MPSLLPLPETLPLGEAVVKSTVVGVTRLVKVGERVETEVGVEWKTESVDS